MQVQEPLPQKNIPPYCSYIFLLLASLVIIERIIVLALFGIKYTGADQTILWQAAVNYGNGVFHEPYYYGQNYNFMFESFLAVPFVKMGIKPHIILPVITSVFTVTPFMVSAFIARKKKQYLASIIFLAILLLLPNHFSLLGTYPGGFMTGVFFAGFIPLAMEIKNRNLRFLLAGMFAGLSFIGNPNSVLVTVPVMTYIFFHNYRDHRFYILTITGILPFLLTHYSAQKFYIDRPHWLGHAMSDFQLTFHKELLVEAIDRLDTLAEGIAPVFWNNGSAAFIIIIACITILLVQKNFKAAGVVSIALALAAYSLGLPKVHEGFPTIFFSHARMFLAVPLLLAVIVSWIVTDKFSNNRALVLSIASAALLSFIIKSVTLPSLIEKETSSEEHGPVGSIDIEKLCRRCEELKSAARQHNADLIVSVYIWDHSYPWEALRMYGCPVPSDLRTWRYIEERSMVRRNILFVGGHSTIFFKTDSLTGERIEKNIMQLSDSPRVFILTNNALPTLQVLGKFNIETRPGLKFE